MAEEQINNRIQREILRSLRDFYPIKVDEIVLVSSVQDAIKDARPDQIAIEVRQLRDKGFVEESVVKAPFGKTETYRFKITSSGIEFLQSIESATAKTGAVASGEIESRLVETYDRIKADMESMRHELEKHQTELEGSIKGVSERIADHDQVIKTYYVRVIETLGVFVGIFAVVVVALLAPITAATSLQEAGWESVFMMVAGIAVLLVSVILVLLLGIRELILKRPKS